ncbi:DUF4276 family protein [uncultured Campylobacter sp.]|uniref:DUF4276 family protein n=1 Tax=uncultured Campylobacter sp. TaxID=218934 RepID=UPI0025DC405D|nr:DUF4276 family protein [uncultured Campylobacter sp.]
MRRVYIICEGQTEEKFIKDVFIPHFNFEQKDIYITPFCSKTSICNDKVHKGGGLSYSKIKQEVLNLLRRQDNPYVTTMFDYYALDTNFPGRNQLNAIPDIYKKVKHLEEKFKDDINSIFSNNRFFPYIQPHEFESLLFSDINEIVKADPGWNKKAALISSLSKIVNEYPNPEEINNSPNTSPSHRLVEILNLPQYRKVLHGTAIAKNIGIENIRQKCRHFDEWCSSPLFQ